MSEPLVESSGTVSLSRWRRLGTLATEQAVISASPYAITWTFMHTAPVTSLASFYICWLWGWGLCAALTELILTPSRVMRADQELPDRTLLAVIRTACRGSTAALCAAAAASALGAALLASAAVAVSLALAALAFFTRRLQADGDRWGLLPRSAIYLLMAGGGSSALAFLGLFTQVTAIAWASISLMTAAAWRIPVQGTGSARETARLIRQVWPQGRWYGASTVMRVVLYSNGLITLIHVQRGAKETAVIAAMFVLVGPPSVLGSVLPWAHLPELRSALTDRTSFARVWLRQFAQYLGILGVVTAGLGLAWKTWVHLSVSHNGLAAAAASERPVALTLLVAMVLNSWTGAALIALEKVKSPFAILSFSGALAMSSVPLGAPATVAVTLPYVCALVLTVAVVLCSVRSLGSGHVEPPDCRRSSPTCRPSTADGPR